MIAPQNDREMEEVLAQLIAREPIFHRPEFGTSRADFERLMAADFREIGASGRRYSRQHVLAELERRYSDPDYSQGDRWETRDFECRCVAQDVYLLTYTLLQEIEGDQHQRVTRRSTIWRRSEQGWKVVFHQGTIVADPE